jgi:OmcA/MtrC family decaheme c-type cytochrome
MDTKTFDLGIDRGFMLGCLATLSLGLTGCLQEGPAGDPGPVGPPGPPGVVLSGDPDTVVGTITGVDMGTGQPTVSFKVTDDAGIAYAGVLSSEVRFTFAKLVPGANGDSSAWQSYINRTETPTVGPGTTPKTQATSDSGGTFTNNGDGTYTYRFGANVTAVTTPIAVTYEQFATHRIGMQLSIGDGVPAVNPIYDFVPGTGATTGLAQREIVATATCNECHGRLEIHGDNRIEAKYCVTCHNPGSTDANSGNTVDMKVMVHKIHMGKDLPSVVAGGGYFIYGYQNQLHDYSQVVFPQNISNCTKCHQDGNPATPQASNWTSVPTIQTCGSCHDDVDFATGLNHAGGVSTSNADCTVCHADGRIAGSIDDNHVDLIVAEGAKYRFNLIGVTNTAPGQFPRVTYSVTDAATGAIIPLTDPRISSGSISARFAWDVNDYHNDGSATANSAPASSISLSLTSGATLNGDGTYSKSFTTAIPAAATGSGVMSMEGRVAVDVQGATWHSPPDGTRDRIPVGPTPIKYFAITDAIAKSRRQVIDVDKCQLCHGEMNGLVLHGGSRNDQPADCVMCHNPDNTDIAQRPVDPDGVKDGDNAAAGDGREDQTIDFRYLAHAIHGAAMRENPYWVYGFGGTAYDFSGAEFPGNLEDCETCHLPNTYYPLEDTTVRLGVTVDTGSTITARSPSVAMTPAGANQSRTDDRNVSFNTAACAACHDGTLSRTHMELSGGAFDALQSALTGTTAETCAICHGPGRSADVKTVHGF